MKALSKYLKKQKNAINLILKKRQQHFTADTFHKLRVEIKKLDALFHLINCCSKGFNSNKTFKPFKLIFKQAGKVRELQIEESILKKHFSFVPLKEYRSHLKKLRIKEQECFFSITTKTFLKTLNKKYHIILPLLKKSSKKKVAVYMDKKNAEIDKILHQKTLKAKKAHALRKSLKEYQYNQKSLNLEPLNNSIPNKNLLPDLLGKWHDYQVIITHLKKVARSGEINPKESGQLKNIRTALIHKREILFHKINQVYQY